MNSRNLIALLLLSGTPLTALAAPCAQPKDLVSAVECVRSNEPSYKAAAQGEREASDLKESAYRLINPQLEVEYVDGNNLGNVERETSAALLFTFELGGKRSARAQMLEGQGLELKADAFEQQIQSLTDLGGAILRVNQHQSEKKILQESINAFRRVMGLYRSRGSLPPEQRVSLNTFELVLLGYERKLIEVDASLLRYQKRVERLFGREAKGLPLDVKKWPLDADRFRKQFNSWVENTPEMLRVRASALKSEGEYASARADVWPNLQIGPTISKVTEGPADYYLYGLKAAIPIPFIFGNSAERSSRKLTSDRLQSKLSWSGEDIRSKYQSLLNEMTKIRTLLLDAPTDEQIQKKHESTENLYQRGMVSGSLMVEAHRALIEHYEAKHELEIEYLEGYLTLQHLERTLN